MKLPDSKTFCVAPWFQIRNENNNTKKVCCWIDSKSPESSFQEPLEYLNSTSITKLKEDLHNGVKNKECSRCWSAEQDGRTSLRQKLNGVLMNNANTIDNTWLKSYFKRKKNFNSDHILMSDIKIGNTCNHACVMCVPDDSSMIYSNWIKDQDVFFIQEKLKKDPEYLERIKTNGFKNQQYRHYVKEILKNTKLKYLKLLGGEPLLDEKLLKDLREVPENQKKNLILYIVTNGSRDLLSVKEYLGNYKSIMFTISLEGIGDVQEYARYGSVWPTLSRNILNFKKAFPSEIIIHTTLQTTTILGFKELANWTKENDIALSIGICQDPDYLSFGSLPPSVRNEVHETLSSANVTTKQRSIGDEEFYSADKVSDIMEQTDFDVALYNKFLRYIKWYENGKKIKPLRSVFPLLFIDNDGNSSYNVKR